ncbi:NAD(P)-dependent oxidoreductase [Amycolatopsis pigmentata]|uniref:NAD(P)-dependent oxidoreductase n=1 Tax=Amycolatopsis pigmentata TaxID=450801 RepID=A0ABW5G645_9PSEU
MSDRSTSGRRVLVLGATGGTGREVVAQALAADHQVTAFVRRTSALPAHPLLETVVGDPIGDVAALAAAAKGHDAVISALGNALSIRDGRQPKILGRATRTLTAVLDKAGVSRVVIMLSYGSGATAPMAPLPIRLLGATLLRTDFADLGRASDALTSSGLDWTVCHFGALTVGPRTGQATVSAALTRPATYRVRRADLAGILLELALTGAYSKQAVVVSGPTSAPGARS